MQSPGFARQFMNNAQSAMEQPAQDPGFPAQPAPGGHSLGDGHDHSGGMSPAALAAFDRLSGVYPDLRINSAYRDPTHNANVGGAKGSQHIHGNAYDISTAGMPQDEVGRMIQAAYGAGFQGIGVYDNSVHFDVGPARAWGPSYGRESLPAWAVPYIRG